jgi:formimidoylglutamase
MLLTRLRCKPSILRRPAEYMAPGYHDPNDRRLVETIRKGRSSEPGAVNILGVPFDGAVLGRRGAAGGPKAIREAMSAFSNYNVELRSGLSRGRVVDIGDVVVEPDDVLKAHVAVESEIYDALWKTSLLVVLGGDNSISLPGLEALSRKFEKVGLVVIDSHLDLRGKIRGKPTSGSSYGLAIETLGLDPHRVVEIGVHGFLNSEVYAKKARSLGVRVFTAGDVEKKGATSVANEAYTKASAGAGAVYLSVDLDAVDLSQVSGVSAPSAGGISARQLFEMVYTLAASKKVKCADIVELAPALDSSGNSQVVAATALVYIIDGYNSRQGA